MSILKYVLFVLVFFYISTWTQTHLLLGSLGYGKTPITIVENQDLSSLAKEKTGVWIEKIKISESDRPFGMMIGVPSKPQLILSRALYDSFAPDEMEYVVLHETGHYALWHTQKELALWLVLMVVGLFILRKMKSRIVDIIVSLLMAIIFGVVLIQLGKYHELQADAYSVRRMTNPQGMIEATNKFREYYGRSYSQTDNKIIQWMFYRANPYDNRIRMANDEIKRRGNN